MSEQSRPKKPAGYEDALGEYETLYWDSTCREPIMWGWKIVKQLDEARFAELKTVANVECVGVGPSSPKGGLWVVVDQWLTAEEAVERYGAVTNISSGPRGGWKSTTYGSTTFTSRWMSPSAMQQRRLIGQQKKR
jgi:hypothetical protein